MLAPAHSSLELVTVQFYMLVYVGYVLLGSNCSIHFPGQHNNKYFKAGSWRRPAAGGRTRTSRTCTFYWPSAERAWDGTSSSILNIYEGSIEYA